MLFVKYDINNNSITAVIAYDIITTLYIVNIVCDIEYEAIIQKISLNIGNTKLIQAPINPFILYAIRIVHT